MEWKAIASWSLALALAACASVPEEAPATITFAEAAAPGGLPGSFREVDGKSLADGPEQIAVTAGRHRIGYTCPNTILLDGPLEAVGSFDAGVRYRLRCGQDGTATFERD